MDLKSRIITTLELKFCWCEYLYSKNTIFVQNLLNYAKRDMERNCRFF